jgi:hypothetical protein
MKGRETGSVGQKLAAKYLAAQYRLLGTQPKGTIKNADAFSDSSFFQPFNLFSITPKRSSLEVLVNGQQIVSETLLLNTVTIFFILTEAMREMHQLL